MAQIQRVQVVSRGVLNKFKFSDYGFSYFVCDRMMQTLVRFDADHDQKFDQQQITKALIEVLHQNPNEIYYVVQNVFRYDRDNDQKVTYQELINFCVQQHFGELAIQRLHKQRAYQYGDKRIMSLREFIKTMETSLNTISVEGTEEVYTLLFSEVDLDKDGFISYQDYFVFLKQYFGSKRAVQAPPLQPKPSAPQPPPQDNFAVDNAACQRYAKLVYNQLKVTTMQIDYSHKLKFQLEQVQRFVSQILQANEQQVQAIANFIMGDKPALGYQQFLQMVVPFYFCDYYINVTGLKDQVINLQLFVQVVRDATISIAAVGPSQKTIKSVFYIANGGPDAVMNIEQYILLMGNIFENFRFDRRGLARTSN